MKYNILILIGIKVILDAVRMTYIVISELLWYEICVLRENTLCYDRTADYETPPKSLEFDEGECLIPKINFRLAHYLGKIRYISRWVVQIVTTHQ